MNSIYVDAALFLNIMDTHSDFGITFCNVLFSDYIDHTSCCTNIMATGGLNTILPAAAGYTTMGNATPPAEERSTTAGEKYKTRVWKDLRHLFQHDELTDVILVAEGQSIPCHKVLLTAASKLFYDKCVRHPESPANNHLDIEGVGFDTLTAIVYFVKH